MRDPLSRVQIKYKLTGAFVGVCLLAFGVGGYLISVSAGSALEREITHRLETEGRALAQLLEARLMLLGGRAEDFASDGFIRTRLADILACVPHPTRQDELRRFHNLLAEHLERNKFPIVQPLAGLAVCSNDGKVVASVNRLPLWPPVNTLTVGAGKDTLWCSPFVLGSDGEPAYFALFAPVHDIDLEKRLGSLVFFIDLADWVAPVFQKIQGNSTAPGSQLTVRISDRTGASRDLGRSMGGTEFTEKKSASNAGVGLANPATVGAVHDDLVAPHRRDIFVYDHRIPGYDWTVSVSLDAQKAMLPVSGLQSRFLGVGLLIAALALVLLFFPVRFLIQPLMAMSDAARAMTAGDFTMRVEEAAEDEIGHLARSFNLMAAATQERTAKLENSAKLLEQKSRELGIERDLLNTVVHSMDDAVLYFDHTGAVVLRNDAAESLLGHLRVECDSVVPRRCGCDATGERDCRTCLLDSRMATRDCVLDVGDKVFEIVSTSIAIRNSPEGVVLVARDISNRLRVDERQAHQDRLAVLGEVTAVMAHELNNPLAAISMFAQLMRKDLSEDSDFHEHLDVILRNTESCKRTIRYLLSYARDNSDESEECDLHELIPDVVRFLRPLYEKSNVCFDLDFTARSASLRGDGTYLRQVLVNLIMNALQAMREEGGRLTIRTDDGSGDAGNIIIDVIDNGPGIERELADAIFEPFFTSKPSGEGTGLGLSISRRIIQSLDGTLVLLRSRPGETVFRISLPDRLRRLGHDAMSVFAEART